MEIDETNENSGLRWGLAIAVVALVVVGGVASLTFPASVGS